MSGLEAWEAIRATLALIFKSKTDIRRSNLTDCIKPIAEYQAANMTFLPVAPINMRSDAKTPVAQVILGEGSCHQLASPIHQIENGFLQRRPSVRFPFLHRNFHSIKTRRNI